MPFYEATGTDARTFQTRSLQIRARSDHEAFDTAAMQGITEIKLRPYTDREMLMLDFKCFLNAETPKPAIANGAPRALPADRASGVHRSSLLLDHPLLTITSSVLLALLLNRSIDLLVALF